MTVYGCCDHLSRSVSLIASYNGLKLNTGTFGVYEGFPYLKYLDLCKNNYGKQKSTGGQHHLKNDTWGSSLAHVCRYIHMYKYPHACAHAYAPVCSYTSKDDKRLWISVMVTMNRYPWCLLDYHLVLSNLLLWVWLKSLTLRKWQSTLSCVIPERLHQLGSFGYK